MREGPHRTLEGLTEVVGCGHSFGVVLFLWVHSQQGLIDSHISRAPRQPTEA